MSDYETRSRQHYQRLTALNSELRGFIKGAGDSVDAGRLTAEQALAQIRDKEAHTAAAIEASWADIQDA